MAGVPPRKKLTYAAGMSKMMGMKVLKYTSIVFLLLLSALMLPGCSINFLDSLLAPATLTSTPTYLPVVKNTNTPVAQVTSTVTPQPSSNNTLVIWVPPEFNPDADTKAGNLLKTRLNLFASQNPDIKLVVRVKSVNGQAGLLESLTATKAAAPGSLPSLIALPRSDLEVAAVKNLLYPLDKLTNVLDDGDWYPYSHQMAFVEDTPYGIPFAGNAMLLLYRPGKISSVPDNWKTILNQMHVLIFPAADTHASLSLLLYQSADGKITDDKGRPILQPEILKEVLAIYGEGFQKGITPGWLTQVQNDDQVWEAYTRDKGDFMVTWSSSYLTKLPVDTTALPLPSLGSTGYTLADGWLWAVADPLPEHHEICAKLAEFLTDSDFMSQWTSETGYLPPRPTALETWKNVSLYTVLNRVSMTAHIYPTNDLLTSLGPVLEDAVFQVIGQGSDPDQVAQSASAKLISTGIK